VKLGFVPPGKEAAIQEAGVVEVLSDVYSQWAQGGGAAKVDVNKVLGSLQALTQEYGNLFQLPPYFAYIARAFGVLEGIGLSNDPDYAILGECLPYVSQRLMADNKTAASLGTFVYGPARDSPLRTLDPERVELLVDGAQRFRTAAAATGLSNHADSHAGSTAPISDSSSSSRSSSSSSRGADFPQRSMSASASGVPFSFSDSVRVGGESRLRELDATADQVLNLILTADDSPQSPLRDIILEEVAKLVLAGARKGFASARKASGRAPIGNGRSILGSLVDPLGLFSQSELVNPNDFDERVLESAALLLRLLQQQQSETVVRAETEISSSSREGLGLAASLGLSPREVAEVGQLLSRKLWVRRQELRTLARRLGATALLQTVSRMESRPETGTRGIGMPPPAAAPAAAPAPAAAAAAAAVATETAATPVFYQVESAGTEPSSRAAQAKERLATLRED
jgi:aarF domain-containing kinase